MLSPADFYAASLLPSPGSEQVSQQTTMMVSGVVRDEKGEPVTGANVVEQGSTNGTSTDVDGRFSIRIPSDAVLEVSFIGYVTQTVSVKGRTSLNIVLKEDTQGLEEVVVVGYGTQRRINLTGAVEQVTSEVFDNRPMTNVTQGLQGAVPNLNITLADGKPMRSSSQRRRQKA